MGRVRLSNVMVILLACAAAGCTTVSPAAGPSPAPTRPVPRVGAPAQPPVEPLLADVTPPAGAKAPAPPGAPHTRAPARRTTAPVPRRPRPVGRRAAVPPGVAGSGPCAMGRAYGGWPAGSPAAAICAGVYGR
ncbi:hypothetical protein HCN08_09835 [Streptomyces sp. PRB2-1]|uniref:Lipoprotein n=1 Tax=Actinacidiphila epipremni TaxID=2053013 RepID=A0ABX0ZIM4_9ACTN|nr:hypothetical protein [Actinacidiphila epipremni]